MRKFIIIVSVIIAMFIINASNFSANFGDNCVAYASPEPPPPPPPEGPNPPPPPPPTQPVS